MTHYRPKTCPSTEELTHLLLRCPELQDSSSRCPELQDSSSRCPGLQDSSSRCPGLQDSSSRCPELQDSTSSFPDLNHLHQDTKLNSPTGLVRQVGSFTGQHAINFHLFALKLCMHFYRFTRCFSRSLL